MGASRHQPRTLAVLTGWGKLSGPTEFSIVPAGRPTNLTDDVLAKVRQMADLGLPHALMASRLGVPSTTWERWIKQGKTDDPDTQYGKLWGIINGGASKLAESYLNSLTGQAELGNVNAITWLLTHHPILRDQFSDAAAERRTERRVIGDVILAITAAGLPPEQERTILLQLQARGLGVPKEN